jgi:hypothetical protein
VRARSCRRRSHIIGLFRLVASTKWSWRQSSTPVRRARSSGMDYVQRREPPETFITLVLPEVLPTRWWHPLLHNYFAWRMKVVLLFRPRTAVTSVPYTAHD